MMMTANEIIERVKNLMNEAEPDGAATTAIFADDTVMIEHYIAQCIAPAANALFAVAPIHKLPLSEGARFSEELNTGIITLPEKFMRLAALRLSSWERTVTETVPAGSVLHHAQQNPYLRAGKGKPVAVAAFRNGEAVIECYPCPLGSTLQQFSYVAEVSDGDPIIAGNALADAVCHLCASLVYNIFGNAAMSASMKEKALDLIPKA